MKTDLLFPYASALWRLSAAVDGWWPLMSVQLDRWATNVEDRAKVDAWRGLP